MLLKMPSCVCVCVFFGAGSCIFRVQYVENQHKGFCGFRAGFWVEVLGPLKGGLSMDPEPIVYSNVLCVNSFVEQDVQNLCE